METEKHIKELIRKKFNSPDKRIYVCSRNPSKIATELRGHYYGTPILRTTENIQNIGGLLDLLDSIFLD